MNISYHSQEGLCLIETGVKVKHLQRTLLTPPPPPPPPPSPPTLTLYQGCVEGQHGPGRHSSPQYHGLPGLQNRPRRRMQAARGKAT